MCEMKKITWYVVQAFSGYEKRVKKRLKNTSKCTKWKNISVKYLVPTEEVVEMRAGQKRKSERKFFPGYVLVEMDMNEDSWHLVKSIPRVLGFIGGTSDRPAPSPKKLTPFLIVLQESVDKPKPKTLV